MNERFLWRIASAVLVVWAAATIAFFALAVLPGDAITNQLTQSGVDAAIITERREALGLNEPVAIRYLRFLLNAVQGNLGHSLLSGEPVAEAIWRNMGPTLTLAASALLAACTIGIVSGIVAALHMPVVSWASRSLINLSLSMPIYWTGTIVIYMFTVRLSISAGQWSQVLLPAAVLGFHTAGAIGRATQGSVRDVLKMDFVRTARAKGLPERRVISTHVLRAALPPVLGVIALQAGFLLSGTVITETLFVRPGLGRLLLDAVIQQDYPIVLGVVVLSATIYVSVRMIADTAMRVFDPRVTF
jgi:ABC-type dipeptide/oligopeptide/nickel transport system permease component